MAWGNKTAKKREGAAQSQALAGARRKTIKGPSWEAQGLEEAGLNRILAITQPTGAAAFNLPQGGVSSASDLANAGANVGRAAADIYLSKAQKDLLKQQSANTAQDTLKKTEETLLTYAQEDLLRGQMPWLIDTAKHNTARALAEATKMDWERQYWEAEARINKARVPMMENLQEWYSDPQNKGYIDWNYQLQNMLGGGNISIRR